ncbi:hypothetical protein ATO6_03060 [Oceanicola sp. 22II-s10i]|uniref:tripartite tricarboxylate transporter permease n=1 Tax=Oceanicola sp. 22II-s10i TaxID=1317116 RepID=UPI000B5217C0|nr:tripartite tricarboxylate transporter permease [Oceanicola sp. 22II-s10i]OWU85884.1 hypothetical protein ATO6_03060 [Oceanicola sp. 22II-s10i]
MDLLANISLGLETALHPTNLMFCFFGVFLGTFIGVLPGIGSITAISMLMPLSFYLDPTAAVVMLAGVYYGAEYGGSTASILLNMPGTPSSAVTCLDGHPLAKQGRAGVALFMTTIASFAGGSFGILLLLFVGPALASVTLSFGPAEYFALMVLGLVAAAAIGNDAPAKGMAMVVFGLLLGTFGADVNSGVARFTFGSLYLYDGINLVVLAMGLFGVAEIIASIGASKHEVPDKVTFRSMVPRRDEARGFPFQALRGASIGSFFGTLPGTGLTMASFVSYAVEKRVSRNPSAFGTGVTAGVVAPEAANNAAAQTAFIPTLTLGVPGSATMALILGALLIHGIIPGPAMLANHPDTFWGLIMSFWVGNLLLLILNIPLIGLWVRLLRVPYHYLYPIILSLVFLGVYSLNNNVYDVGMLLVFGAIGYGMRLGGFSPAPLLIGFILGPMIEENFRRAMMLSRGDFGMLVSRPITGAILALSVLLLVWMLVSAMARRRAGVS